MTEQHFARRASDQAGLDSRALEIAMEAKTIILQHQQTCAEDRIERRRQIDQLQISLAAAKSEVSRLINRGMAWFIGILVVCMGYFLVIDGLPGKH